MSNEDITLDTIEEEIHFAGRIQPHGILLACEAEHLTITHASQNASELLHLPALKLIGKSLAKVLPQRVFTQITNRLQEAKTYSNPGINQVLECHLWAGDASSTTQIFLHHNVDRLIIIELMPQNLGTIHRFLHFYQTVQSAVRALQAAPDFQSLCDRMSQEIAQITGFDRVLIYRYNQQWDGQVIAETKQPHLDSFLGLHFPDVDTRVCRSVYQLVRSRIISDISTPDVAILPQCDQHTTQPLDLTYSLLRGVSPCHQEYLANMGAKSTLVLSIIYQNQLWGLISCHHTQPYMFSYEMQQACEFLSQVFSVELTFKQQQQDYQYHLQLQTIQAQLVEQLSQPQHSLIDLCTGSPHLLDLFEASGAVVCWDEQYHTCGDVPAKSDLIALVHWLNEQATHTVFATHQLSQLYPAAQAYTQKASGLLAIAISPHRYLLWFRPEVIQTVNWAGNPQYPMQGSRAPHPLTPRASFDLWQETVIGQALPWQSCELEVAQNFQQAIINIVLRQAATLEKLNQELARSNAELERFAYIASHDLQEPLNLVASYVQLLEMRYTEQLGPDAKEFINFAVEGVSHMQTLIDDLLAYSRIGTNAQTFSPVETQVVLDRVLKQLHPKIEQCQAVVINDPLPTVWGDSTQILQLFQNLLGNALKFCQGEPPQIKIRVCFLDHQWQFSIRDNGIGIDPQFQERIFLIFQRLHTRDEYPGTGIGLAICKKIVEHHGGQIWIDSMLGQGTTVYFTLGAIAPPS